MIRASKPPPPILMEELTDPEELAKARALDERFDRNFAWLQAHGPEIYARYRGKCLCIAGEELFAADTPEEVLARPERRTRRTMGFSSTTFPESRLRASMRIDGE